MPYVLIASSVDLSPSLGRTVLWRAGMERRAVRTTDEARRELQARRPDLLVIDRELWDGDKLVLWLRKDPALRQVSVLVVAGGDFEPAEVDLLEAGVNAILRLPAGADWDERVMRLIDVPARKETRFPLNIAVDTLSASLPEQSTGTALNLSLNGMLIESSSGLSLGDDLDLAFRLPTQNEPTRVTGRVVRIAGVRRYGVEFRELGAHDLDRIRRFLDSLSG